MCVVRVVRVHIYIICIYDVRAAADVVALVVVSARCADGPCVLLIAATRFADDGRPLSHAPVSRTHIRRIHTPPFSSSFARAIHPSSSCLLPAYSPSDPDDFFSTRLVRLRDKKKQFRFIYFFFFFHLYCVVFFAGRRRVSLLTWCQEQPPFEYPTTGPGFSPRTTPAHRGELSFIIIITILPSTLPTNYILNNILVDNSPRMSMIYE